MSSADRITNLKNKLLDNKLSGFIVTNPTNIFYLSGFKGVSPTERESILIFNLYPTLITARLYQKEAHQLISKDLSVKIASERDRMFALAQKLLTQKHPRGVKSSHLGGGSIGFEENDLKYSEYLHLASQGLALQGFKDLVENMRLIKNKDEIKKIEKAQMISQKAFSQIVKTIKVGQTEAEIAEKLSKIIKILGGDSLAFESIIASGTNSSKPHHVTSRKPIAKGEVLLFDFGAKYRNYCADLSRTIFVGKANTEQLNIYNHVQTAQKKALSQIIDGIKASEAFHAANNHFKKHRLDKFFIHGLGHGIGLEVHEKPHLRPPPKPGSQSYSDPGSESESTQDEIISENMVFSVEPGLYLPWGGVRIEDLVVIKNGKAKVIGWPSKRVIEIY